MRAPEDASFAHQIKSAIRDPDGSASVGKSSRPLPEPKGKKWQSHEMHSHVPFINHSSTPYFYSRFLLQFLRNLFVSFLLMKSLISMCTFTMPTRPDGRWGKN
jgi:hypothetical protein